MYNWTVEDIATGKHQGQEFCRIQRKSEWLYGAQEHSVRTIMLNFGSIKAGLQSLSQYLTMGE